MTTRHSSWVRIGADTTWVMLALGLGLSVVGAAGIAAPVSELVRITSGTQPGWLLTALWTFVVLAVLLCVPLVIMANRPASIDLDAGLVRVAWRTVPFAELRHVHRMPGGTTADQFVIQLELERGLDARLPVRSAGLPNLTVDELEVLLEMLGRAPIEPRPGLPVRSPIADELGPRSSTDLIADEVSDALQPFGRVAYAKPTLLLEVEDAIARAQQASAGADWGDQPLPSERLRAASAVTKALVEAPRSSMTIMPTVEEPGAARSTERFSVRRRAVEEWLTTHGAATVNTHTFGRVLGWAVVIAALIAPWIMTFVLMRGYFVFGALPLDTVMGWWAASVLTWPFGVWLGFVLLRRARALRNTSARRAALALRSRGVVVPGVVRDFFASTTSERSYGTHVYLFGLVLSVAFLASGFLFLALSGDMVGGPYSPLAWHAPLGWLLLVPAIPVFVGVLRWQRYMHGQLARAQVEWRLLGNSSE
ncbi:MAG: hypothetical protein KF680_05080 [Cryobacterium sp.]|nr:hypothetical protein [Cryobacterium sp.]